MFLLGLDNKQAKQTKSTKQKPGMVLWKGNKWSCGWLQLGSEEVSRQQAAPLLGFKIGSSEERRH